MRILVVNDDGIDSPALRVLAEIAKGFGEVCVAAPASQCSGMSQHISVFGGLRLEERKDLPVDGVKAYAVSGTPADCVKAALAAVYTDKPDLVFSGINHGYNLGLDCLYSGTIGAATEGITNGIRSVAFSAEHGDELSLATCKALLPPIIEELLKKEIPPYKLWNINVPSLSTSEIKGVLWDRSSSGHNFYQIFYPETKETDGIKEVAVDSVCCDEAEPGSDIAAVLSGYIAVGTIENALLKASYLHQASA